MSGVYLKHFKTHLMPGVKKASDVPGTRSNWFAGAAKLSCRGFCFNPILSNMGSGSHNYINAYELYVEMVNPLY